MAKVNIEVGQTIFVTEVGFYESKPHLHEYMVTKVNGSSFYAYPKDSESKREYRFDRKKMICKTGYGYTKIAYATSEEYWNSIQLENEKRELRSTIQQAVTGLDIDMLRKIDELIKTSA